MFEGKTNVLVADYTIVEILEQVLCTLIVEYNNS